MVTALQKLYPSASKL